MDSLLMLLVKWQIYLSVYFLMERLGNMVEKENVFVLESENINSRQKFMGTFSN